MLISKKVNPAQYLVLFFFLFLIIGTLLLKLPISCVKPISLLSAFFTATSALTVTGLNVVDPGTTFTLFGQWVILFLIQLGGLGIMTFAVLVYIMIGKRFSIKQRLILQEALNQSTFGGIIQLVKKLFYFSLFFEGFIFVLLSIRLIRDYGFSKGVYYSLFHTISAFNNAGFSLWPDGLNRYGNDPTVIGLISFLFIIGGIGFTVMNDLWQEKNWRKFSLHTKVMLIGTLIINMAAFLLILFLEWHNPKTLLDQPLGTKFLTVYFQSVSPRTAGFNSINISNMSEPSLLLVIFLMFIGSGSISTGGGIKLTTFFTLIFVATAFIRGKENPVIMERTIKDHILLKALVVFLLGVGVIFIGTFALLVTEQGDFLMTVFEVVSAFGTVGLSLGLTNELSHAGQLIIALIMIIGKLGPLSIVYTIANRAQNDIRYPNGRLFIG